VVLGEKKVTLYACLVGEDNKEQRRLIYWAASVKIRKRRWPGPGEWTESKKEDRHEQIFEGLKEKEKEGKD
jgi:hypothetical protein